MRGGFGPGGFGYVMFHKYRKVTAAEWSKVVEDGSLAAACRAARPDRHRGPWHLLCDNESFLQAPASRAAHFHARVELCQIPPRSPDLYPVEMFWSWLRRRLRAMDLADLRAGRAPMRKSTFKIRVRALLRSSEAQAVAKRHFRTLRTKCLEVRRRKGAALRS